MENEFNNFILGCILFAPLLFLIVYLFKKKILKPYDPPRSMMDDPWEPINYNRSRDKLPR